MPRFISTFDRVQRSRCVIVKSPALNSLSTQELRSEKIKLTLSTARDSLVKLIYIYKSKIYTRAIFGIFIISDVSIWLDTHRRFADLSYVSETNIATRFFPLFFFIVTLLSITNSTNCARLFNYFENKKKIDTPCTPTSENRASNAF